MAKKMVRGITDVNTITNQDFDTNNVNDLLSDGQYNYIHRKKGKSEEYHNLTDNIKTLSSDNTDLLTVTNNNKTTNTATLHPKHDAQKEQVLQSTRSTIAINHGANGTAEKTTVDTNPQKVLEHENLISDSEYITLDHQTDVNKTHIKTESLKQELQQLHQTKQDTLVAGDGITIEGQTISYSGASSTINYYFTPDGNIEAYKHLVQTSDGAALTTFSFECYTGAETVLTGELKQELEKFVEENQTYSNSAITLTNDGTTMKLINSAPAEEPQYVRQHATFTFYGIGSGGGGAVGI